MGAEKQTPSDDKIQSKGGKDNAAQHVNPADPDIEAERYPPARRDDGVESPTTERRSFEGVENPRPPHGAGGGEPDPSVNQGRMGPQGDPAEGKR